MWLSEFEPVSSVSACFALGTTRSTESGLIIRDCVLQVIDEVKSRVWFFSKSGRYTVGALKGLQLEIMTLFREVT